MFATPDADAVDLALLIVRLFFGLGLAWHGLAKVRGGLDGTAKWFGSIGMRQPQLQARAAVASEIVGGLLFAAGLLTPLAAAAIIGTMLVAGWLVHRKHFLILNNGCELVASYAMAAFAVGTIGAGRFSLDNALGIEWNGWNGALISAGLGIAAGLATLVVFWRPNEATAK